MIFRKAVRQGALGPETVLELTVKTPDGREMVGQHENYGGGFGAAGAAGFDETIKEYRQKQEKVKQRTEKISLSAVFFIQKFDSSFA